MLGCLILTLLQTFVTYEQRIREVDGSFVPLVLSVTGGMGRIATTTYKR